MTDTDVYAVFAGLIDQSATQRFFQGVAGAMAQGVEHIHCLFQSTGGNVNESVALYNFFRTLPVELSLYNAGGVASGAVIAYLGAQKRKTSACNVHAAPYPQQPSICIVRSTRIRHTKCADG